MKTRFNELVPGDIVIINDDLILSKIDRKIYLVIQYSHTMFYVLNNQGKIERFSCKGTLSFYNLRCVI